MKIGEIIEVEGVQYIAQQETLACRGCCFDGKTKIDCYKEFGCESQDNVIFVEIPIELLIKIEQLESELNFLKKKLYNERDELNILENFSGLLGKQYLFLQDDGTYYNRYTDEYMSAEDAEHWLYSELSSLINRR